MTTRHPPRTVVSPPRLSFRTSRAVVGLLLATTILALLLSFSTIENIHRAESHMRQFLIEKGEAIIHVLEAGSRTSVMHMMGGGNPLHTLLTESSRQEDIVFIRILDARGNIVDEVGFASPVTIPPEDLRNILAKGEILTQADQKNQTFIVSRTFNSRFHLLNMHMRDMNRTNLRPESEHSGYVISIGLLTKAFEEARRQDVRHAMFMGALLFLVGSAGLYFAFLYQGMRVARATLANMNLYTDSIIESIPVSLITLDSDNNIVSCNRNCEELFGRSFEELRGENIGLLLPQCAVCPSTTCSEALEQHSQCTAAGGRVIPIRLTCSSLVDHANQVIGRVLIVRDMSSIQDMELQLERSRRLAALGKMATGIAHEIRNPLGTLRGFAQYFGNQATTETGKQYADLMVSEVDRLNKTVSGLLQFARPREPQIRHVQLDEVLAKTCALMSPDIDSHGLRFTCSSDTGITMQADPDLLLQVLMNLLKNSIYATSPGGRVGLEAVEEQQQIRISVIDTGKGMSEQEQERMFDPFFTTGKTGTGLGLAVSHQIVEQHHGTFEVRSAPGEGTKITIIFPRQS